jgi:hypothetical protein
MDLEQLEVLEQKISEAVRVIEALKVQNQRLANENRELLGEVQSKEQLLQKVQEENQNLNLLQKESSLDKEKEEKIKSKVEQMLSKLDELETTI